MSIESYCCLCYTASFDFQLIQNEEGESTEAYDITVKYFDPMVCMSLNMFFQPARIQSYFPFLHNKILFF